MLNEFYCIQRVEQAFEISRKAYRDYFYQSVQKSKYDGINRDACLTAIDKLLTLYTGLRKTRAWHNEMIRNSSNDKYLTFALDVFLRQHKFLLKFQRALRLFQNEQQLVSQYIKRLQGIDKRELINEEIQLGIQLFYIELFFNYEMKIDECIPRYKVHIELAESTEKEESNDFIRLGYGEKNNDVLLKIHSALQKVYIDESFENFKMHFEDVYPSGKIRFIGSQANLINLFFWNDGFEKMGLKIENGSPINVIIKHFKNKDGKDFTWDSLNAQENKMVEKPRNFDKMKKLLEELMVI